MGGRHRKKRSKEDVTLNLAAMLDMAFQLLTFFILTFKPAPVEGQVSLRLPPPHALNAGGKQAAGDNDANHDPVKGDKTLVVTALGNNRGELAGLALNETPVAGLGDLAAGLKKILADPDNTFDQVIVQVGSELHYDSLMKVVEICAAQTKADGTPAITKLSFVENPG